MKEAAMNLRSLVPFRDRGAVARGDADVFGSLQREIDRLFDEFAHGFGPVGALGSQMFPNIVPRLDVTESDKEIEIAAELPGLERKDVEISLENDLLTIRGEKKTEVDQNDKKNKNYHLTERSYGVFYRVLQLPAGIDPSTVKATMSKGVLKITIPKPARSEAKKIEVKEAA
jgi:HSP20 family protein